MFRAKEIGSDSHPARYRFAATFGVGCRFWRTEVSVLMTVTASASFLGTFPLTQFGEALTVFVESRGGATKVVVNP